MNVIYPYTNPFQKLVSAHAISGLALLGLFAAQVTSGVTGQPSSGRRVYHRVAGNYVVAPLILLCLGLAAVTEIMANLCCQDPQFSTTLLAIFILSTFGLGFRAAKQKRWDAHKDWMMWATLLTCHVGITRIGMLVMQPLYRCDTFLSDWPFVFSTWLSNLAATICLRAVGRLSRRHKANLFLWLVQMLMGGYYLASAIAFECPADRIAGAGAGNTSSRAVLPAPQANWSRL